MSKITKQNLFDDIVKLDAVISDVANLGEWDAVRLRGVYRLAVRAHSAESRASRLAERVRELEAAVKDAIETVKQMKAALAAKEKP